MMDPIAGELLNDYPKPNSGGWTSANYGTPGSGNLYQNYSINDPIKDTTFQWDQRLDWNISAKDQTYMRYSYSNEHIGSVPPLGNIIDGSDEAPAGVYQGHTVYNLAQNFPAWEACLLAALELAVFRNSAFTARRVELPQYLREARPTALRPPNAKTSIRFSTT